jgi:hypothetical protein
MKFNLVSLLAMYGNAHIYNQMCRGLLLYGNAPTLPPYTAIFYVTIQTEITMKKRNKKHTNDTSENTTEKNWRLGSKSKNQKTSTQAAPENGIHSSPVNDLLTTPLLTGKLTA